jgi:hypothetical protein
MNKQNAQLEVELNFMYLKLINRVFVLLISNMNYF